MSVEASSRRSNLFAVIQFRPPDRYVTSAGCGGDALKLDIREIDLLKPYIA